MQTKSTWLETLRKHLAERDMYSSLSASSSFGASNCAGIDHNLSSLTIGCSVWFKVTELLATKLVPLSISGLLSQVLDSGDVFAEESEEKLEIDSVVDRIVVECSLPVELSGLPGVKNVVTGFFLFG